MTLPGPSSEQKTTKTKHAHKTISRGADLDENWCTLHSFSRGIRIWHSWGPVLNKNDKKQQNYFSKKKKTMFCCFCRFCCELGPGSAIFGFLAKNYTGYTNSCPNRRHGSSFHEQFIFLLSDALLDARSNAQSGALSGALLETL